MGDDAFGCVFMPCAHIFESSLWEMSHLDVYLCPVHISLSQVCVG